VSDSASGCPRPLDRLVFGLAAIAVLLHGAVNWRGPYQLHRDELLYLAMGNHLRLWQMDFPPGIALLGRAVTALGDSPLVVRLPAALGHGLLIILSAVAAREFGGTAAAQRLAAMAVALGTVFLRPGNLFQPVVLDQLSWTLGLICLARLVTTGSGRWWLGVGLALGAGLLTKFSIGFIAAAIAAAVLLTPERRWFTTRWPWLAVAIALLVGAPAIAGQINLDWPVRSQLAELEAVQLIRVSTSTFLGDQPLLVGPAVLLAVAGAWALLAGRMKPYRVVALSCLGAFLLLLVLRGKSYYVAPIYPVLFGAGAVQLDQSLAGRARRVGLGLAGAVILAFGLIAAPLGLPFLQPATMARYAAWLGLARATETNRGEQLPLPQDYADMLGWREMADAAVAVYRLLPEEDRARAVLIGENYGEAGALEWYGRQLGLPPGLVVSAAGSFWFFGPGERSGEVAVTVGVPAKELARFYGEVRSAGVFDHHWMVSEERRTPLLVARKPHQSLQSVWPSLRPDP
jgi:hypothetical protein